MLGCCSRIFSTTNEWGTVVDDDDTWSSSVRVFRTLLIFDHIVGFVLVATFTVTEQQSGVPACVKLSSGPGRVVVGGLKQRMFVSLTFPFRKSKCSTRFKLRRQGCQTNAQTT